MEDSESTQFQSSCLQEWLAVRLLLPLIVLRLLVLLMAHRGGLRLMVPLVASRAVPRRCPHVQGWPNHLLIRSGRKRSLRGAMKAVSASCATQVVPVFTNAVRTHGKRSRPSSTATPWNLMRLLDPCNFEAEVDLCICERIENRHGAILVIVRECSGFNPRRLRHCGWCARQRTGRL